MKSFKQACTSFLFTFIHVQSTFHSPEARVWALKRLKILIKFSHHGPGGQNGPNFWSAYIPQIQSSLSRSPGLLLIHIFSIIWNHSSMHEHLFYLHLYMSTQHSIARKPEFEHWKDSKFWSSSPTTDLEAKMDQIFDRPIFPKFKAPWVGALAYMLESCRGGSRPISLGIEKT